MSRMILYLIRQYRKWISPLLGVHCRFHPTCSAYTEEAVRKRGAWAGAFLAAGRLLKCHPFHPGGLDPVE